MNIQKDVKRKRMRGILTTFGILTTIFLVIYLFPIIMQISTPEGRIAFKTKIDALGPYSIIPLFLLQVAQIFLFVIPGEPIEILIGMCYGGFWGTVFVVVSASIISTTIFFLVRKYGRNFVCNFVKEEKIKKIEESKLYNDPQKIEYIVFLLFFITGTPKDFITYICGLLPIKPKKFILITTFARIPTVISSTLIGANIASGNFLLGVLLYIAVLIISALVFLIISSKNKDKSTKEIIDTIK